MLSKNNQKEQFYKQEPKKQRFAIKKLTVGVASVLIGFTFMGISNSANADQVNPDSGAGDGTTSETPQSATAINSGSAVLSTAASAAPASASASAASQAGPQTPVADAYEKIVAANAAKAVSQTSTANVSQSSAALQAAQLYGASFAQMPATTQVTGQTESVANYSDFLNALSDHSVSTITLTGDIDGSTASGGYDTINTEGTARSVTIDGQGKYGFKLGGRYIYLTTNTENNTSTPWNITFANLTHIQAQNNNYGLLCVYTNDPSKNGSINFHNVNVDATTTTLTGTNGSYGAMNVTFSGNNTINGTLTGSNTLVAADNLVFADGTTTVTPTANNASQATSFSVTGNAVVNSGATLNINSTVSNVAGITFTGSAGNQTIDNASAGVLDLQPTATVSMNLGAGKSMAVMNASDINLQPSSKLTVNTKMGTTGFRALAPIELDAKGSVANSTFRIGENATLSVVREGVTNSDSPLVSMGPNDGLGNIYNFEVNGGSVNLQDSAYSTYLPSAYSLSKSKYTNGWAGLLTMWGTSGQNYINFNNAKLINLQRTAEGKPGYLIHTDAAGDANHNSHIRINSEDTDYVTPLTMITAGSATPTTWAIKYLNNKSQGGDYAYAFRSSKNTWNTAGSEYMNDSVNDNNDGVNEVILAANPNEKGSVSFNNGQVIGGEASQSLNNFINHFSWWNGSGVKFGSDLQLENQYNASYSHVDVQQGQTVTVTPSFTDKDGKNATMPTGTQFTAGDNMPTWTTVNPTTGEVTLKPGTDVKIGAYNLPVKVTYSDTTSQTVNVPVVVTNADQNVTWGQNGAVVVTVNPDIAAHETTANSQVLLAPDAVSSVQGYKLSNGQLSTTPTNITVAPADVSWTTVPSTNVDNATVAGKQIENNSVKINFANNDTVKDILGDKTSVTSSKFTINAKGAGAKDVKTPVNVQLGADLTSEQFSQLVDSNIPSKSIASTAWETKPVKGQDAMIKITFTDKDANGQPTYLNVTIPAKNLNVIGDNDNYEPTTQPITTPEGTVPEAPTAITNKNTDSVPAGQTKLPEGTQITWTNPDQVKKDVEVPGTHDETITVTYPDGTKDTVTTTVTVNAAPAVQPITVDLNGTPDPTKGITNLNQGDGYPTSVIWNQTPDTTTPGVSNPTATVSYKSGNPVQVTIPVIVINPANQNVVANEKGAVIVTTNPVETHKTNTANEADAQQAVKNIAVYTYDNDGRLVQNTDASTTNTAAWTNKDFTTAIGKNGSTATVKDQAENITVSFANGSDAAKITNAIDAPTTVTLNGATAIEGVTAVHDLKNSLPKPSSLVNIDDLTEAHNSAVKDVVWEDGTPSVNQLGTVDTSVTINFTDGSSLSVPVSFNVVNNDADAADPQTKNISTDEGVVPEAPTAITNKDDLPQGTVITWTNPDQVTDDVKTPGTHEESITVTYPDGTKDTVTTDVTVNQAPQTQPISTGVHDEPGATATITNLRNNVPGYPTSATWKTAPDTKTPGDKTGVVTVTYPDGTTKDVTVKVTVDEAPQVKDVSTKVGSTPVATDTIANLHNNVPGYPTSATWKTAPDTSKVGTTTGEVTVTYPDGTTKDVTVKVTVTDYANQYPVSYGNLNIERPTTAQSVTNSIDPTTAENMPTGAITGYQEGTFTAPTGVSVTVDPVTGKVSATVNQDADLGSIEVPVEVTYRDGTTATVNVPVSITGSKVNPGDVVYYGNQTMTVFSDNLTNVHKTTGDSTPAAAASQFETITFYTDWDKDGNKASDYKTQVVYKLNADGTKYVNANNASDSFDANVVNYAWQNGFAPNTNTTNFANGAADTLYKLANGEVNPAEQTPAGQPLGGNSKYRYDISISDRAVLNKLGLSMKGYHSWANVYYNFYGATGKTDVPVNYNSEVPTDSTALEDYLASNGIAGQTFTNGNVTGIKWASMPGANGKFNATNMNGTIEFTFDNGTKLDVPVSFKTGSYVPTSDSKVNDDTNLYVTRTIEFNVPSGQKAIAPITQTVHYVRDGYHNVNAQGEDTSAITWNAWQLAAGQTAEWAAQPVTTINDEATGAVYAPQIAGKTVTEVPAETVTENTKDTTVTVDYAETTTPIKWDATKDNMTKDVTRTITVNYPAGVTGGQPAPQVVHFTREDAKGNAGYIINGKTEMNAWHLVGSDAATGTWTEITAPTVKGYTADPAKVAAIEVTPETSSTTATINYTVNDQSTQINFVDQANNKTISTQTIDGQTGETVNVTLDVPANWEIVGGQDVPSTITFGPDGVPTQTVYIKHKTANVNNDTQRTVSYKVVEDFNGTQKTVMNATATFTRTATKDLVTGDVTYGDWKTNGDAKIDAIDVAQPGYTARVDGQNLANNEVPAVTLTPDFGNKTVTVTYVANEQSVSVTYVDQNGQEITMPNGQPVAGSHYEVTGKTGETVATNVEKNVPANWQLVPGESIPTEITFGSTPASPIKVVVEHGTKDVTNDPSQEKQTHRTIEYKVVEDFNGSQTPVFTQPVSFARTATEDLVTGTVTYGSWTPASQNISAVNVAQPGYTAQVNGENLVNNEIPATVITPDSADQVITVTYLANEQSTKINYVNNADHNDIVGTQTVTGKTGEEVKVTLDIPAGWQAVGGQTVPSSITFGSDGAPTQTVYVEHKVDTTDGRNDQNNKDVYRIVTRTITINFPDQAPQSATEALAFYRIKSYDEVTKQTTYTAWTSNMNDGATSFQKVEVPTIGGYSISATNATLENENGQEYVPAQSGLNNGTPVDSYTVVVNYTAQEQQTQINYVNNANHNDVVATQTVSGKTGENVKVDLKVPANWQVVGGQTVPSSITFGSTPTKAITVYIEHQTKEIKNDETQKTVSYQVVEDLNGTKTVVKNAQFTFERPAIEDLVTGEITYGSWGPDQVAPEVSVAQPGYTAQLNGKDLVNNVVPETTITPTTPNQVITVTYVANEQSAQINFVNNADHNDVVATQTVNGKTGENVKVTLDVPTGWQIVGGQTVPSSIAFGSTPVTPTTVYVEQKVDKTDGRDDKTNTDLYRVVTRTIIVNIPGQPAQSYPESLDFYRIKSYNEVTKKTTYSPWTSNMTTGETSFQQVTVPTLGEYTISATGVTLEHENGNVVVPAQSALFNGVPVPSYTITINYTANEQSVTINYVDNSDHKTVVGTQTINGKAGEQVPVTLDVPANWQIVSGQQVPQSITFGTTPISDKTVYVEHKTKDVTNDPSQKNKTHKVIDYKVVEDFNGTQTTVATATLTFDRTATEDLVTGDVTYGKWNVESRTVPAVNVAKAGYTAQVNGKTLANGEVPAATFTPESESQTVTVTYTANEQNAKINFVDNDNHNQIVGTQTVNGKTGENVKVTLDVPAGWQVVSGQNVPSSITFGSTPVSDTTVYVEHKIDKTDGRNDKTNTDVYRTVTRTIVVNVPGQKEQTSSETLAFYRIKSVDEVTKNVSYTAWTSNMDNGATAFTAVSIPTIKGYTASATEASLQTINGQEYVPVQSALKNGTPVDSYTVTVNYAKDGNVPVPFDPTNQDMYREVTRTINVTDPVTGETATSVQTAKFTREDANGNAGYTDPVTGKTTMNPWTPAEQGLSAVNVEQLQGYTANVDGNAGAVIVTPDSQDMTVDITYTANKPVGKDIETPQGTVPPAKDGIKNVPDLPTDTTYTWKTTPDVTKPGTTDATIVVTYPDGTKTEVPVQVVVTETTPTPTTTDADKYTPSYPDVVTTPGKTTTTKVTYDGNKPTGGVTYQIAKGATVPNWVNVNPTTGTITTTVPTDAGTQVVNIPVTVTYEDGSSDETTATVVVVATKDHVDVPTSPKDTIKDPENLPTGTTVEWTPGDQPDPNKKGDQPTNVTVTVPGHEPVNVPTTVNYGNPTDADKYTPEGQLVKTIAGTVPNANKGIANLGDLPQGTTVDWSTPDQINNDVKTPGTYNEGITVTYPDGSKDTLTVTVTVTTPVKPEGTKTSPIGQNITINKGAAVPDPSTAIANKAEMPDGTQYDWKNIPDTNKTGKQQATIVVTYPDGTKTSVTITINVVSDADKYEPQTQPITVPTGVVPDPAEGIKNKADLPDGTKYTWTNPDKVAQDVKRTGSHTETVTVTYPDGSQDQVTVTVTAITPQGQDIHTPQGVLPNPGDAIANKGHLPDGTTYTWQQQPDVSTVGDHTGVVKVTFPDGSTYDVTVNVHVDAHDGNGETTVKSNDTKTNAGEVVKAAADAATATNKNASTTTANDQQLTGNKETTTKKDNEAAQNAKKLPQTGNDAAKGSALTGLGLASLAGTLGMAARKKRKHEKND